jgi:serine O-acetyltransferase
MPNTENTKTSHVWENLMIEAQQAANDEPALAELLHTCLIARAGLEEALCYRLARKLGHHAVSEEFLHEIFLDVLDADATIGEQVREDLIAVRNRDPATDDYLTPFLYYKGFQALSSYRFAHNLWKRKRKQIAWYLQSIVSEVFQVDIHPAARIGCGILIDHATGVVIGETALIEDNVSLLHAVTLGGTGKEHGDRHPKIRSGVLIGAGAKILGNVEVGVGAKIGAGSVVLNDVSPHTTVAGVPAVVVGEARESSPALDMDHNLDWSV